MNRITLLKFILIAFALPAQYLITQYWSKDINQQRLALRSVLESVYQFKSNYFELESWKKWYFSFVVEKPREYNRMARNKGASSSQSRNILSNNMKKVQYDDDIAIEVLNYRKNQKNFGGNEKFKF